MTLINVKERQKRKRDKIKHLNAKIFTRFLYKINFSDRKSNDFLLSIDLLKEEIKKDLLSISSKNLEELYFKISNQADPIAYMKVNGKIAFIQLLNLTCRDFLTKQYGCNLKISKKRLKRSLYTKNLLQDLYIVFQVTFYALLYPKANQFKSIYFPIYSYASESFLEALVDNLIVEIANCIVYFCIVNFSFLYAFRQTLYQSQFLSLRNFERIKNNLIWQLQTRIYITNPADLYNNRCRIYILRTSGIYSRFIYANRTQQIVSLTKLSLFTITLIELRDFLISRFDEILYFFGKTLRFTLTSVFGQFIGLVWRGIIEGLKK
jgi:hypothetical protein